MTQAQAETAAETNEETLSEEEIGDQAEATPAGEDIEVVELVIEFPVRMLHTVACAGTEDNRYSIIGVNVETREAEGLLELAATDGRRLIVAQSNRGLFDCAVATIIPAEVAKNAAKIASRERPGDEEPMATLWVCGDARKLTVYTDGGDAVLSWHDNGGQFPPYRSVIPNWDGVGGAGVIGVKAELVAGALKTLQKIIGDELPVRVYIPASKDGPIGFEGQDGDTIKALAVVMPCAIDGWRKQQIKGDGASPASEDLPAVPTEDESWREVTLDQLGIDQVGVVKALTEKELTTLGKLADWTAEHGDYWHKDIPGIGKAKADVISDAIDKYWADHPREPRPEPEEARQDEEVQDESDAAAGVLIHSLTSLGITHDELRVAYYPNLLAMIQGGKVPKCEKSLELQGRHWIAAPAPIGVSADYQLRNLLPTDATIQDDGGPFTGAHVKTADGEQALGPDADRILVRV